MDNIVIKTIVHLKDSKKWEKICEHNGNCDFEDVYMERRRAHPSIPFELEEDQHKYILVSENFEQVSDNYYFKHQYYEQSV